MIKRFNTKLFIQKMAIIFSITSMMISCSPQSNESASNSSDRQNSTNKSLKSSKINKKLLTIDSIVNEQNISIEQACISLAIQCSGKEIFIEVAFSILDETIVSEVKKTGITIEQIFIKYKRISASYSTIANLNKLADISQVTIINPQYGSITH